MIIRKGIMSDFDDVKSIYAYARRFMAENGNPHQWGDCNHPTDEYIKDRIKLEELYVVEDNGVILACFEFSDYDDPDYKNIDGKWLNEDPYVAIHTVASKEGVKGMFDVITNYVKSQYDNIKMDTHKDNKIMQHLLSSRGFVYCGLVHVTNGDLTPRLAYQYVKKQAS